MNSILPSNWSMVKLSEIAQLIRGVSYKKEVALPSPQNGYIPILRANNINSIVSFDDLIYVPEKYVKKEQLLKEGDILIAMSSGSKSLVGKAAFINSDYKAGFGTFCGLIRVSSGLNKKYFGFYFQSKNYRDYVSNVSMGININNLRRSHLEDIILPLPPLSEQNIIVSKLESLFSELDKGVETLRKAKEQIKTYRQSVLASAFEGKLTDGKTKKEKGKSNPSSSRIGVTSPDKELNGAELNMAAETKAEYKANELPEGWKWVKLGEILKVSSGKGLTSINMKEKGEYPVYGGNGINGFYSEYLFKESKLILGRVGAKCGVVHITQPKCWITDNALVVDFKEEINIVFFYYCLSYHNLNKLSVSTAQPVISGSKIYSYEIMLPPIKDQVRIVSEIERRFSVADKLEQAIDEGLIKAEQLRQSILKQAFEGKLV